MIVYHRGEGEKIRRWALGWQWWHGPTLWFRTDRYIYVIGRRHGVHRRPFDFGDFARQQALMRGIDKWNMPDHLTACLMAWNSDR